MASGMNLRISVEMQGLEEFHNLFKQIPVSEQRKILIPIFKRAARPTVKAMKSGAPVSSKSAWKSIHRHSEKGQFTTKEVVHRPGELKRSIGITVSKKSPTIFVGPKSTLKNDAFYWLWVSIGHLAKIPTRRDGMKVVGRSKANPYLDNAWKRTQSAVFATIKKDVSEYLAKRFGGANGR